MAHNTLHEIDVYIHHDTPGAGAWFVSDDGDEDRAVWIPKSQVTVYPTKQAHIFRMEIPEWLGVREGLL